jgi:dipeptidyl aminopeptidase/acylaminoacyl peptidase
MVTRMRRVGRRNPLLRVIIAEEVKSRGGEGKALTIRMLYLPALLVAGVLMACAAALLALSEKAEATFPGKNGRIAYQGYDGNDWEIYTINPNGRTPSKLTNNNMGDLDPSYAPDGKRIAYTGWDGHDAEIYTIKAGGGGKTKVTHNSRNDAMPSYSPNGKRIAYTSYTNPEDWEIYTIKVGGGGKSKVTEGSNPSWGSRP